MVPGPKSVCDGAMPEVKLRASYIFAAAFVALALFVGISALRNPLSQEGRDYGILTRVAMDITSAERQHYERFGAYLTKDAVECAIQGTQFDRAIRRKYLLALTTTRNDLDLEVTVCSGLYQWCKVYLLEGGKPKDSGSFRERNEVSHEMRPMEACRERSP